MADRTPDGRFIVVDGRRWRASDPALDEDVRRALVSELMSARRAVRHALDAGDDASLEAARRRVHDAKVALGERGRPWWEPPTEHDLEARQAATNRALGQTGANRPHRNSATDPPAV